MAKTGIVCACGKTAKKAKLRFQGNDVRGWKCSCGEEYFHHEDAQRILYLNKVKKKEYEVKLGQIRSNLIIRIPKELADALGMSKGATVKIQADDEKTLQVQI